jgi:hypothetical protein
MLVDVEFGQPVGAMALVLSVVAGHKVPPERIEAGIYTCGHWNFGQLIVRPPMIEEWPQLADDQVDAIGVCDSPEQMLEAIGSTLRASERKFCVSLVRIRRDQQPPEGGWRWHKWGTYIGKQQPTCEYLYREPVIEEVWTYHVFELGQQTRGCDSGGKPIQIGDRVKFRSQIYTIKAFGGKTPSGATMLEFNEPRHTDEQPTEFSVDLVPNAG